MDKIVARNVLIVPDEQVVGTACDLSNILSEKFDTKFVLDGKILIPHITLYLAKYPGTNLEIMKSKLNSELGGVRPFKVRIEGYSNIEKFIFWNVKNSVKLQEFHEKVVKSINSLRSINNSNIGFIGLTSGQSESFGKWGTILAFGEYLPHVTLTRLSNKTDVKDALRSLPEKKAEITVDRFQLSTVGRDGTCTSVIEEFSL